MDALRQDLGHVFRSLRRKPGFAVLVAVTLGLGIGASTAIFTVFDAALLRPLPFPDPERLVFLGETSPSDPYPRQASYPDYRDWSTQVPAFASMGAYGYRSAVLTGGEGAEVLAGSRATASFFATLGVSPHLGRSFTARDEVDGDVVLLGHGFWKRRFGSDPAVVGRSLTISGQTFRVIGVLPASFRFDRLSPRDVWVPLVASPREQERRYQHMFWVVGRLRPEATLEEARVQLAALSRRIAEVDPRWHTGTGIGAVPLHDDVVGTVRPVLRVLLAAVGLVLMIAAANVANVLLARGAEREREVVLRSALGATRARLVRQMLVESVALALIGGAVGVLLALWGAAALVAAIPSNVRASMAYLEGATVDGRVLLFALLVSLLAGVVAGLAPALRSTRDRAAYDRLKQGAPSLARGRHRLQDTLVASEVAMALVLLLAAGLLGRSFVRLMNVDPGFDTRGLLTLQVAFPPDLATAEASIRMQRELVERMKSVPGVRGAALIDTLSLTDGGNSGTPTVVGRASRPEDATLEVQLREVSASYFDVMGIAVREGRGIDEDDVARQAPVMVVNEAFRRRLFPGEEAVGRQVTFAFSGDTRWEIVGVVGDERVTSVDATPPPTLYWRAGANNTMAAVIRTVGDAHALAPAVERAVREVSRDLAVFDVGTMDEVIAASPRTFVRRYPALLLASFGGTALLLALVGIYGVLAHDTARRTREIGVRMALGAPRHSVLALVLGRVLVLAGAGIAAGTVLSVAAGRLLSALLFGVAPGDPATTAAAALLMLLAALAAAWLPARRAVSVDPAVALRDE